jgi:hypothetical protein
LGGSREKGLAGLASRWRRWLSPPAVELPEEMRRAVAAVYPALDRSRVSFHLGIPHVFSFSPKEGITLPAPWPPGGARVYLDPACFEPGTREAMSLVLHESCHALQIQECGWGLGLAHPFILLYLATAAGNGFRYWGHPLEDDAYRVAGRRSSLFESHCHAHAAGGRGEDGGIHAEDLAPMVTEASGLAFWGKLARSVPGLGKAGRTILWLATPGIAFWLLFWGLVTALCGLGELILLGLGKLAAGIAARLGRRGGTAA